MRTPCGKRVERRKRPRGVPGPPPTTCAVMQADPDRTGWRIPPPRTQSLPGEPPRTGVPGRSSEGSARRVRSGWGRAGWGVVRRASGTRRGRLGGVGVRGRPGWGSRDFGGGRDFRGGWDFRGRRDFWGRRRWGVAAVAWDTSGPSRSRGAGEGPSGWSRAAGPCPGPSVSEITPRWGSIAAMVLFPAYAGPSWRAPANVAGADGLVRGGRPHARWTPPPAPPPRKGVLGLAVRQDRVHHLRDGGAGGVHGRGGV